MRIVAFGHRQRTGKDTAAKLLITELRAKHPKLKVGKVSLSEALKEDIARMYAWGGVKDFVYYENNSAEKDIVIPELGKSPRQFWLELGYAAAQMHSQTYARRLLFEAPVCDILIVPDLRREAEADCFMERDSLFFNVKNPRVPKLEDLLQGHKGYNLDAELDDWAGWTREINNMGTMRDLNDQICAIVPLVLE
jgi:hypothetical protein